MDVAVRVTTPHRPLPRSLEPLADESFPGYLLRLAHRLDLSPARLAAVTGLTLHEGVPVSRMLALEPAMAEEFGRSSISAATTPDFVPTDVAGRAMTPG